MSGHSRGRAASPDGGNVVRGGWPVAGPPAGGGQCRRRAEGRPSGCRAARCPPRRRSGARAVTPSYGTGQRSIRRPPAPSDTAPAATPVIALLPRPSSMLAGSRWHRTRQRSRSESRPVGARGDAAVAGHRLHSDGFGLCTQDGTCWTRWNHQHDPHLIPAAGLVPRHGRPAARKGPCKAASPREGAASPPGS